MRNPGLCVILVVVLITGYNNEAWNLMSRGTSPEGLPMCHVRRIVHDTTKRATVWRLVKYPNGWRNVGQFLPGFNAFRPSPERRGKLLSNSRVDLTLLSFAQEGHANVYA